MEVGKLKIKLAVGKFGGAVLMDVIESCPQFNAELHEFGAYLDDLFHGGTELPKEPGIYVFDGIGHCSTDEYGKVDDSWYLGEFKAV